MPLKTLIPLMAGLALLTGGCSAGAPQSTDQYIAQAEKSLAAFNEKFNANSAGHDVEGLLSLYTPDALWIAPGERPVAGYDAPRETFSFVTENKGFLSHTVDHLHISDDASQAVMIGEAVIKVDAAGMDATGTYLFVLKRDKDSWKIVTDMFHQHTK